MNIEKYTERARGFVQSAQSLALREGHQQFTPEHLLKVLLDDPEGLAGGLIGRDRGRARQIAEGLGWIRADLSRAGDRARFRTGAKGRREGRRFLRHRRAA